MLRFLLFLVACPLFAQESELELEKQVKAEDADVSEDLLWVAHTRFDQGYDQLRGQYLKDLAKAVLQADRAEIFLLDFEIVAELPLPKEPVQKSWAEIEKELDRDLNEEDKVGEVPIEELYFPIVPYDCFSKILKRKTLGGDSLASCREAVAEILNKGGIGGGAFCHYPIHAIRLFKGEQMLFETSLCWKCGNYFLRFPNQWNEADWIGIGGGKMAIFCMKEMPIPQTELERFETKYGAKK